MGFVACVTTEWRTRPTARLASRRAKSILAPSPTPWLEPEAEDKNAVDTHPQIHGPQACAEDEKDRIDTLNGEEESR